MNCSEQVTAVKAAPRLDLERQEQKQGDVNGGVSLRIDIGIVYQD